MEKPIEFTEESGESYLVDVDDIERVRKGNGSTTIYMKNGGYYIMDEGSYEKIKKVLADYFWNNMMDKEKE